MASLGRKLAVDVRFPARVKTKPKLKEELKLRPDSKSTETSEGQGKVEGRIVGWEVESGERGVVMGADGNGMGGRRVGEGGEGGHGEGDGSVRSEFERLIARGRGGGGGGAR